MPAKNENELTATLESDLRPMVPHLAEYFGIWAIWDQSFRGMFHHYKTLNIAAHIDSARAEAAAGDPPKPLAADFRRVGGNGSSVNPKQIAFIEITGPMMKFRSSLAAGTSTVQVRRQIRDAMSDSQVGAIVVHFDTPGGTYAGTADLADDIAAAAKQKPTVAFVSDMCASAGYWAASQATEIVATKTSVVGSIGTFLRVEDTSAAAESGGIKVHILRAGAFKGRAADGVVIDAEALAEFQAMVDTLNEFFVLAVADGRKMKLAAVRDIADGRIHIASEAKRLGLINRVSTLDAELTRLNNQINNGKARTMTEQTPQTQAPEADASTPQADATPATPPPPAATLAELEAACPGAPADFVLAQLKSGATVAAATTAFIKAQHETIAALQSQPAAGAVTQPTPATAAKPDAGVTPLPTPNNMPAANGQPAADQMRSYVRDKVAKGFTPAQAMVAFNKEHPQLRQMVIEQANT